LEKIGVGIHVTELHFPNSVPGQDWDSEIRKAIRRCEIVLVCLSRSSVAKQGFVPKEIVLRNVPFPNGLANGNGSIFLLAMVIKNCFGHYASGVDSQT
jgi:hypothetical protein